ncbi:NUDIX hydrolase [Cellulomonas denverensis]|uniref:NUDIX hydrolase n=1 Tax=Cellulomonas denverensis TaxID=264297 RepID=A0A7X6QZG9_9CELL|nr:NUDIX hydrolase [Cellulomonas denverensis]NKY23066.1 NUDIX hydrolase [Cellulomonas denverensis]GIG23853.1 ADP-ribose pyrophosphatase [Cellulomonas denverensis]
MSPGTTVADAARAARTAREAKRPQLVEAAGALVWRVRQGRLQVALVHRPRYRDWSWPKGKVEPEEHVTVAAIREVEEETGLPIVLGRPLPGLEYALSDGRHKRVHYWAAQVAGRPEGPALHARPPFAHAEASEIDRVAWMDATVARRKLTRRADTEPLDTLVKAHQRGRLDTRAFVVVRHGRARSRAAHDGAEQTRPLTPVGRRQAEGLVPLLSAFGVAELVSSPWARCRGTVEPYATAAGLPVTELAPLTEHAHRDDPAGTAAAVEALITERAGVVDLALCTHRPVLPTVVGVIADRARGKARAALPTADPWLRPGEMLVAHVATAPDQQGRLRVQAVERHLP